MILFITDPMASEKSTAAALLAETPTSSVHLRGDVFRKMIKHGRVETRESPSKEASKQLNPRNKITAESAKLYHKAGFILVLQDKYYDEKLSQMLNFLTPEEVKVFSCVLA